MLLLSGCASKSPIVRTETVEVKVPVRVRVPDELLQPIPMPALPADGVTNADLVSLVVDLRVALRKANERLEAIRKLQPKK